MLQPLSTTPTMPLAGAARWGCLRALPQQGDAGEALVSLGAEQWLRLPISCDEVERRQLRLGQCVAVDTAVTPMRLVAVRP